MELPMNLIILGLVINRIVEAGKAAVITDETSAVVKRWGTFGILFASFAAGAASMLWVFPADNLFPSASSPAAGLIFSGILVGGIANGWDFLGGLGQAVVNRVQAAKKTA